MSAPTPTASATAPPSPGPGVRPPASSPPPAPAVPLDDVMIAMDVVDTLRHDERLVARELDDATRRKALIDELREIYRAQGIEVPDRILEEGVSALEQDRFLYKPPADSLQVRLARLYVSRGTWGRFAVGGLAALAVLYLVNLVVLEWPRQRAENVKQIELAQTLPQALQGLASDIASEAKEPGLADRARELSQSGLNAARAGDAAGARKAREELAVILADVRSEYDIRIVSRRGELTGLWRIPSANPNAYNYYLVVEAIGRDGKAIPQAILNEETGKRETVATWAVRVPREVLSRVEADKRDDGIVQNAVVGRKLRGQLERSWSIAIAGGLITRW